MSQRGRERERERVPVRIVNRAGLVDGQSLSRVTAPLQLPTASCNYTGRVPFRQTGLIHAFPGRKATLFGRGRPAVINVAAVFLGVAGFGRTIDRSDEDRARAECYRLILSE